MTKVGALWAFNDWRIGGHLGEQVTLATENRGGAGRARFIGDGTKSAWFDNVYEATNYAINHQYIPEGGRRR